MRALLPVVLVRHKNESCAGLLGQGSYNMPYAHSTSGCASARSQRLDRSQDGGARPTSDHRCPWCSPLRRRRGRGSRRTDTGDGTSARASAARRSVQQRQSGAASLLGQRTSPPTRQAGRLAKTGGGRGGSSSRTPTTARRRRLRCRRASCRASSRALNLMPDRWMRRTARTHRRGLPPGTAPRQRVRSSHPQYGPQPRCSETGRDR